MAPVLPFTAGRGRGRSCPGAAGVGRTARLPARRGAGTTGVLARWSERCSTCASEVTEGARGARARPSSIASSLEAQVDDHGAGRDVARLCARTRSRARLSRQPGQPLHREPRGAGGSERALSRCASARAAGGKCERCWTYSENVGRLAHPGVCERCAAVLEAR